MKHLITLRLLVEPNDKRAEARLEQASKELLAMAVKGLTLFGFTTLGKEDGFTKPTKEEAMRLVPRRTHWGIMNGAICCDKLMPASRLTENWARVDCKMCLRRKPKTMQTELAL